MRKLLLATPLLVMFFSGCEQSLDELIARHIEAMGGLQTQRAVQTIRITQRVETGNPADDFKFVIMRKRGNKFRMEQQRQISGCDGQTSWFRFGDQPARLGSGLCAGPADIDDLLMTYKEKGLSIELVGKEKIEGKELYHLKLTSSKNAGSSHLYLDAQTFLVNRIVSENRGSHREDIYSDYRKADGVMVAFCDEMRWWRVQDDPEKEDRAASLKVAGESGQQKQIVEKIEFNMPLDDALFAMPPVAASDIGAKNP